MITSSHDTDNDANKRLVRDLYARVYNGRDVAALADLVSDDYVEHNPEMQNGRPALADFLANVFGVLPEICFNLAQIVSEGDRVVAHALMRRTAADRGTAIVEIFRISDGKVVERWDVAAPVPETSVSGNPVV